LIEDIVTTIKAQLYERVASPLMGAFIFSWFAWNYKFLLILFSDEEVIEKFRIINEILYVDYKTTLLYGVLFPIITTLIYLFLYPYPARFVYQFTRNRQKEISDIKKKIEEESLLTVKESQVLRRQLGSLEEEYQKIIAKKDGEIENMKLEIARLKDSQNTESTSSKDEVAVDGNFKSNTALDDIQENILKAISIKGETVVESEFLKSFGGKVTEVKFRLGELEELNFLKRIFQGGRYVYELTHKGREYLVKNNLL
jgi:hypothetical protein